MRPFNTDTIDTELDCEKDVLHLSDSCVQVNENEKTEFGITYIWLYTLSSMNPIHCVVCPFLWLSVVHPIFADKGSHGNVSLSLRITTHDWQYHVGVVTLRITTHDWQYHVGVVTLRITTHDWQYHVGVVTLRITTHDWQYHVGVVTLRITTHDWQFHVGVVTLRITTHDWQYHVGVVTLRITTHDWQYHVGVVTPHSNSWHIEDILTWLTWPIFNACSTESTKEL